MQQIRISPMAILAVLFGFFFTSSFALAQEKTTLRAEPAPIERPEGIKNAILGFAEDIRWKAMPSIGVTSSFGSHGAKGSAIRAGASLAAWKPVTGGLSGGLEAGCRLPVSGHLTSRISMRGREIETQTRFTDCWVAPGLRYEADWGGYVQVGLPISRVWTDTSAMGMNLHGNSWMFGPKVGIGFAKALNDIWSVGVEVNVSYGRAFWHDKYGAPMLATGGLEASGGFDKGFRMKAEAHF